MTGTSTALLPSDSKEAELTGEGGDRTVVLAKPAGHALVNVRDALHRSGMTVVAEASDASEALEIALRHQPELCILEDTLPGDLLAATREIFIALPKTRIAVLADEIEPGAAMKAIRAGADGYLPKSITQRGLINALTAMLDGEPAIPRALAGYFVRELRRPQATQNPEQRGPLNRALFYWPRFGHHLRRRMRSGMPFGEAWASSRQRMGDYR